jgi:myo-inositol catabolism protein IolC
MTTPGFNEPLYILPFDHRGSFQTRRMPIRRPVRPRRVARRSSTSSTVKTSPNTSRPSTQPSAKSWFAITLRAIALLNQRQAARLKRLSEFLQAQGRSRFMFELLVPPEKAQLDQVKGNKGAYDLGLRPRLMAESIRQLQDAQVEPDVWKIEGLDRQEDCQKVVAAARRGGRDNVGCIILGRGENDQKVREWLTTAAMVPGFIGFAVGRTSFWDPLVQLRAKQITREAVAAVARRYREYVDIFENAQGKSRAA